ncbi:hypothetical protein [uncultured Devosia sp.]|uniref:hypothetical protein n=1 Tax=uncultured Devosia sp. TaxID=211434 RepID=UPI002623247F|nr:hypothetical protein [uncultured Devosia sp.]
MFLLRSAFWLTLAFLVIRPSIDGADGAVLANQAMARGSQFVAAQIDAIECTEIQCLGGKALASAALRTNPLTDAPMHVAPVANPVPLPRPRPDRAG